MWVAQVLVVVLIMGPVDLLAVVWVPVILDVDGRLVQFALISFLVHQKLVLIDSQGFVYVSELLLPREVVVYRVARQLRNVVVLI